MRDKFLKVPAGYAARWLSDAADRALVERWTSDSPEATVYHASSYVEFAREQNGYADLLWLTRAGNPVLGIPVYPVGAVHMRTGYSGVMFARGPRDAPLRRGVTALMALLDANACLGFEVLQCAQAPAYDDPAYVTSLEFLLASHRLHGPCLYSRVLDVEQLTSGSGTSTHGKSLMSRLTTGPDTSSELLLEHGMAPYEAELRNQIRQAIRYGLRVTCALPSTEAEITNAYSEFTPLHRESWERTGWSHTQLSTGLGWRARSWRAAVATWWSVHATAMASRSRP